ncbi:MAG: discoidin domain-containing protein, partial [Faecalibacillus sp.]
KNVETSSVSIQAPTFIGSLSVDGDLNTRWASVRNEDDNWITIDLGKKANIDAIEILWEAACSDNYQIEVSDDNKEWTIVKQDLKTDSRLSDHLSFEKQVTGRYIKIHSLKSRKVNNINYGINIFEINIYGTYQRFETNIALNKQTETSSQSTQAPTYTGDLTVDGDLKTRWASLRNENDNWITIDLGKKAAIDDIVINWEAACSDNYQIEISDDHQEWTIVKKNLKTNSDYNDKISFDESIEARYVKIHSLKSKTLKYGINIYEIEIYGEYLEEEIPEVNIALNKPAYASSEYTNPNSNFTLKAQYAFDGSVENKGDTYQSRWVSQRRKDNPNTDVDAQYIYVDLQDYYDISKIVLNWEGACAKEYQLQVSTDGKTWQDIEHITDGKSGVITFTYDQEVIARYVKMKGIEPATQYGYSLWEFEVYGTKVTVDKSGLKELIEIVSATDETQYTPNSYQVFKKALDNANEIYNKELVTKEEVEDAENTLRQAYQSLIKKVDNSQLLQLIQKAEEIDRSLYTLDSVKKLENAIREAKESSQNQNITKDEMDLAITHLNQAI